MKNRHLSSEAITEFLVTFLVCTAAICILEGVIGMIFMPEQKFGYEAFFSPPLFAFFSVLLGLVTYSKKELTVKQVLFRRALHLLLIEALVFGLNYASGITFPLPAGIALAFAIMVIFVMVYLIMYINDKRSAKLFNEELKRFQENEE